MSAFTLDQARALLPEVQAHTERLVVVRADLAEARAAHQAGEAPLADLKALEARFHELAEWYPRHGIELKGIAPVIIDFPSVLEDRPALLCWLEGEPALAWYHRPELGFLGRRRLPGGEGPAASA